MVNKWDVGAPVREPGIGLFEATFSARRRAMKLRLGAACLGVWLALASAGGGAATTQSTALEEVGRFELNFVGICSRAWEDDFRFYTQMLGMRAHSVRDHWVLLGAGWDDYVTGRSRALVCEIFEAVGAARSPAPMRLGIRVADLDAVVADLKARGVRFDSSLETTEARRCVAFSSPSGTPWVLKSEVGQPAPRTLETPAITSVELRVRSVERSRRFYSEVLGMKLAGSAKAEVHLAQSAEGPHLILLPGGTRRRLPSTPVADAALAQPHFLGFMTADVREAARSLRHAGVRMVRDVTHHAWGGTDLHVADPDGNVVQVYQLDDPRSFGAEAPR